MALHALVAIDCRRIRDWSSFHSVFAEALGFPDFYGRNMNAWVDCLTYVDEPGDAMTTIRVPEGGVLVLQLNHAKDFIARCGELYQALVESSSFVNWRRIEQGGSPVLVLSFSD